MRRALAPVLAVVIAGALGALAYHLWTTDGPGIREAGDREAQRVPVEVGHVERRDVEDTRRLDGTLEALVEYDVAPKIAGQLRRLHVDLGDEVRSGELIAELDDAEARQEVAEAQAALEVARAELAETRSALDSAQRELRRTRELREREIASQAELEAAEAQVTAEESRVSSAQARIAQRQAALASAQVRLSFTEIRATWDDERVRVVGDRYVDPGATVSAAEPILSLLDVEELRAVAFVTERDYGRLRVGQPATIHAGAFPERTFQGTLHRLAPRFSPGSRQARVEFRVPNPERRLRPGMFVRLGVHVGDLEDALTVPRDALVRRDGAEVVFRVRGGDGDEPPTAEQVMVRVIARLGERVVVEADELDGRVVTLGQHLLQDGTPLQLVEHGGLNGGVSAR